MKHRLISPSVNLSDAVFLAKGATILKGLESIWGSTEDRPAFVPTLLQLHAGLDKFHDAYIAAINHDSLKIKERKAAKAEFARMLDIVAPYVDASAGDDISLLHRSGFDVRKPPSKSVTNHTTPAAPAGFSVHQGDKRGTLFASLNKQADAVCFELHITEGDPTVEENWRFLDVHVPPNMLQIDDHVPGKQISLRSRGHNAQGKGAWSSPISIIPN